MRLSIRFLLAITAVVAVVNIVFLKILDGQTGGGCRFGNLEVHNMNITFVACFEERGLSGKSWTAIYLSRELTITELQSKAQEIRRGVNRSEVDVVLCSSKTPIKKTGAIRKSLVHDIFEIENPFLLKENFSKLLEGNQYLLGL